MTDSYNTENIRVVSDTNGQVWVVNAADAESAIDIVMGQYAPEQSPSNVYDEGSLNEKVEGLSEYDAIPLRT